VLPTGAPAVLPLVREGREVFPAEDARARFDHFTGARMEGISATGVTVTSGDREVGAIIGGILLSLQARTRARTRRAAWTPRPTRGSRP
jgi:hypothetical protein